MAYNWGTATTGARAKVLAAIDTVTNVGATYDYERFADDWTTLLTLYQVTIGGVDQLRGWTIALQGTESEMIGFGLSGTEVEQVTYRVKVRGLLRVNDASESQKTFEALILAVKAALETSTALHDNDLSKGASGRWAMDPVQMPLIDMRVFGTVLCHYGELDLRIVEVI
jgi:hypothetical protein